MHPLFEKYQRQWEVLLWVAFGTINALINATSVLMESARVGQTISTWMPFVWEFSSQIALLMLLPLVIKFESRCPIVPGQLKRNIPKHLLISIAFSITHVVGMVLIRKAVYALNGLQYDFGHWPTELFYEYRKDLWTYILVLAIILCYRFIISRLKGEASAIAEGEDTQESNALDRLLVKKLGKEFIIRVADIQWIEAAGNYVNLHVNERIYPMRETMAGIEKRLEGSHFVRIHRSAIVNINAIAHMNPQESGDALVILHNDKQLKLSRRYRGQLISMLEP